MLFFLCVCVSCCNGFWKMARLFSVRCWDDPGTTGVYIYIYSNIWYLYTHRQYRTYQVHIPFRSFLTTLHASDIQGLLIAGTSGPTANWERCQVNVVGVLGTIVLKCQVLSSTPDRYLKLVIIFCSYGTGYMLQHLFALKKKRWEATSHGCDFIYAVAMKTTTIRP